MQFVGESRMKLHAVYRTVTAKVVTNKVAYQKFEDAVHEREFLQKLEDAQAKGGGRR
jgi:hypothetical protein